MAPLTKEVLRSVCEASGFSVFVKETRRLGDASVSAYKSEWKSIYAPTFRNAQSLYRLSFFPTMKHTSHVLVSS